VIGEVVLHDAADWRLKEEGPFGCVSTTAGIDFVMSVALTTPRLVRSAAGDRGQGDTDLLLVLLAPLRGYDNLFEAPAARPGLLAVALCGNPPATQAATATRIAVV